MAIANITNNILTDSGVSTSSLLPLTGGTLTGALSGTSATFSSTTTATAFIPSGSTIPTNGMYLSAANTLNFATNSLNRFTIASDGIATFGTDLYVNRNIYVNEAESGIYADFHGRNSTNTSTPLAFLYGSAGTVTWNNGGTKMTLTSAGALQLVSSLSATSATFSSSVTAGAITSSVATGNGSFYINNASLTNKNWTLIPSTSGTETDLLFFYTGASAGTRMTLTNAGNVGIGTSSPSDMLQVGTTLTGGNLRIVSSGYGSNGLARFFGTDGNEKLQMGSLANDQAYLYTPSAVNLLFYAGAAERMRITSAGVINTTSRLNVNGAGDNSLFSFINNGTTYTLGFSPNATASTSTTLTITTATTTWIYNGTGTATWTLPNPSGTNQMFWIRNAGTGTLTLNAFSGTNIVNTANSLVSSITIAVGATALIQQDGNIRSYQLQ